MTHEQLLPGMTHNMLSIRGRYNSNLFQSNFCRSQFETSVLPDAAQRAQKLSSIHVKACRALWNASLRPGLDHGAAVTPSTVPLTFSAEVDDGESQNSQQDARNKGERHAEDFMAVDTQKVASEYPI